MTQIGFVPSWLPQPVPPTSKPLRTSATPRLRATYDAAGVTAKENREHWAWAGSLSANALNDPVTRQRLRDRARYECRNNGYAKGLVSTLAQDLVGTGPRLVLTFREGTPGGSSDVRSLARLVERDWRAWCEAVDLADRLRVMHESRVRDGDCFALLTDNDAVPHPVKLDVQLVESDQVDTPLGKVGDRAVVDGVELDRRGNAVAYFVSREHPGDRLPGFGLGTDFVRVPAGNVLHWFRPDRPGQARGVSELAPSLSLFAHLRRYTLATVLAAEFAATAAGVMKTDLPPPEDADPITVAQGQEIPLAPGSLLTLASGWDATQLKAEHPTTTYGEFKHELIAEMGRPANAPRNLTSGDSSQFNFASGRLDHLPYQRGVWLERRRLGVVLRKLFAAWWAEYTQIPESEGGAPQGVPPLAGAVIDWQWDGFASLDPVKETAAVESRLNLMLTTLAEECAAEGKDWEENLEQWFKEAARKKELAAKYGVELAGPTAKPAPPPRAESDEVIEEEPVNA